MDLIAKRTGKLLKGGEPDVNTVAKMVINDWQRGKIPYFVPPPGHDSSDFEKLKIEENLEMAKKIREQEEEEEEAEKAASQYTVPTVLQNLRKITLSLQYSGDDDRPAEITEHEHVDYDDEVEEEEDIEDEQEVSKEITSEKEVEIPENKVEQQYTSDNMNINENIDKIDDEVTKENKDDQNISRRDGEEVSLTDEQNGIELEAKNVDETGVGKRDGEEVSLICGSDGITNSAEPVHDNGVIKQASESVVESNQNNEEKEDISEEEEMIGEELLSSDEEVNTAAGSYIAVSTRKVRRKRKHQPEQDEKPLTSKEKRRIERAQKRKKVGSNFYEVTNVKNRNRDKVKPVDLARGTRGHLKTKKRRK